MTTIDSLWIRNQFIFKLEDMQKQMFGFAGVKSLRRQKYLSSSLSANQII